MTTISQDGRFEWDSDKDEQNVAKHGFSFSEILEVFDDPYLLTKFDANHSTLDEERYFSVGCIRGIVITAVTSLSLIGMAGGEVGIYNNDG